MGAEEGILPRGGARPPAPCKRGGRDPSSAQLWSPVQRQIQEEPLDSLSSSIRQQAMETLAQLRCPQPLPLPHALLPMGSASFFWGLCCGPTLLPCLLLSPCPVPLPLPHLTHCGSKSQAHPYTSIIPALLSQPQPPATAPFSPPHITALLSVSSPATPSRPWVFGSGPSW